MANEKYSMYCDDEMVVRIAGLAVDKDSVAKLPFKWLINNKVATAAQIRAEWEMVRSIEASYLGYYDVKKYNQLYLTEQDVQKHVMVKL